MFSFSVSRFHSKILFSNSLHYNVLRQFRTNAKAIERFKFHKQHCETTGHVAVKFLNGEPTAGGWTVVVGFVLAGMGGYEFYKRNKKLSVVHAFEEENNVTDEKRKYTLDEAIIRSRDLCQRIKDESGCPGLTVAVNVNGKTVWNEGLGFADIENRLLCKPETIFRIASISKPITMAMVAKLWENGDLNLDKPVQYYVPDFPEKTFQGKKVVITTRQLVSHLSGIRHYYKDYSRYKLDKTNNQSSASDQQSNTSKSNSGHPNNAKQQSKEEQSRSNTSELPQNKNKSEAKTEKINKPEPSNEMQLTEYYIKKKYLSVKESLELFKNDPLVFLPGTKFLYTTHGWTVVSAVVEGVTKMSFEKCAKKLFKDLGMDNTFLEENAPLIYNRGRHYVKNTKGKLENAPYVDLSYKWAGGGFISNVIDLVKFGDIMLYCYQSAGEGRESQSEEKNNGKSSGKQVENIERNKSKHSNFDNPDTIENKEIGKVEYKSHEKLRAEMTDGITNTSKIHVSNTSTDTVHGLEVTEIKDQLPGYLKAKTMKMMWEPLRMAKMDWNEGFYGMGWGVCENNQEHGLCKKQRFYISHTGGAIGASSVLLILPSQHQAAEFPENSPPQGVVVAILVNMTSVGLNKTALEIAKIFENIQT